VVVIRLTVWLSQGSPENGAESPDASGDPLNLLQIMLAKGATRVAAIGLRPDGPNLPVILRTT